MNNNIVETFIKKIEAKKLIPSINLERPEFVQPEDRILYRASRVIVILGMLNTKNGLSKEVVACMDFLLRNPAYQKKFIIEYFKANEAFLQKKIQQYSQDNLIEFDYNIVQYKSVPWDLRFNDMFLFLKIRRLVNFIGNKPNLRVILNDKGKELFEILKAIFIEEINFLELFQKRLIEAKAIEIITDIIPNSYWKENEKFSYQ